MYIDGRSLYMILKVSCQLQNHPRRISVVRKHGHRLCFVIYIYLHIKNLHPPPLKAYLVRYFDLCHSKIAVFSAKIVSDSNVVYIFMQITSMELKEMTFYKKSNHLCKLSIDNHCLHFHLYRCFCPLSTIDKLTEVPK